MSDQDERASMTEFWTDHSQDASQEEMMLDDNAATLSQYEVPEILGLMPDTKGKTVLEIGAGIGRYTGHLARQSDKVIAVDFMEKFIEKNKVNNKTFDNIDFMVADGTTLNLPENSVDIVFTNWLLMYMTDAEVGEFFRKVLRWLRPNGYLFFRESCYHRSGNAPLAKNPTHYRDPLQYTAAINMITVSTMNGVRGSLSYELVFSKNIDTYIKLKGNPDQICWLIQKKQSTEEINKEQQYKTFQEFLDQEQYSRNGILRYEKIFGKDYVSTGGKDTTEAFVKELDLEPGQRVLDVGSGIGGSAFHMAEQYDARVVGIDLSFNMVALGWQRLKERRPDQVNFLVGDVTKYDFQDSSFDVVYSRDTILHIPDKVALFTRFLRWLKPGGKLMISDYCCSDAEHSTQFKEYVKQRGYVLLSPRQYGETLQQVGFTDVKAEDKTDLFVDVLKTELDRTEAIKDDFIQEFDQKDYDAIVGGWKDKLVRCDRGDQRWGLFQAKKPL